MQYCTTVNFYRKWPGTALRGIRSVLSHRNKFSIQFLPGLSIISCLSLTSTTLFEKPLSQKLHYQITASILHILAVI